MIGDIMSVSRLRMGTDGQGISTLVAFFDCPLHCKYCANDCCHEKEDSISGTPRAAYKSGELVNVLRRDEIYYLMTGGGVVFGGGEPLLQSAFIHEVCKLDDVPLSESEFAKIKNDLSHASFYDAGKWLVGENGKVYVHVQRGNETLHLVVMNNEHVAGGSSVYEVINQYQAFKNENDESGRNRRFDVTLLINGIPMIHIELKNKEHSYMDGYRQIKKYIAEGKFHGIFSNVQMFVVSRSFSLDYSFTSRVSLNESFVNCIKNSTLKMMVKIHSSLTFM